MKIQILSILIISAFPLMAQNQLKGKVSDAESLLPLQNVSVYIPDLRKGSTTNADGAFLIDGLPKGKFLVEFKLIGYTAQVNTAQIEGTSELTVMLTSLVTELNEVVVTGISHASELKRNPIPLSTINNQSLLENTSTNLIDNITKQPGVNQISTGTAISKPVIRGLSYNRIITLYDGIRQEGQQWGDEHGIEIDEFSVDRVEIIKGAGSLMYGGDGLAGVVHFLSANPEQPGTIRGKWFSNYQSNNGLFSNSIVNSGNVKGIYWLARATHKMAKAYSNAYDGNVFNSAFNELNFNGTVGINRKWGYSEFSASSFNQNVGLVEGDRDEDGNFIRAKNDNGNEVEATVTSNELNTYSLFVPKQSIQHIRISNTTNVYIDESRIQINAGLQRNQRKEYGDVMEENRADLHFDLQTLNYNLIYFLAPINKWEISVGTSGMVQENKNKGGEFIIPEYSLFDWGVFGFGKRSFGKFDVAAGVRYDQRNISIEELFLDDNGVPTNDTGMNLKFKGDELQFSNLLASAGITYEFSKYLSGKFNISRGFRAPNVSELASNGKHEGTLRYEYGNYALSSETSLQIDGSLLLNSQHVTLELALFQNAIDNYIYTKKLLSTDGVSDSIPDPNDPVPAYQYVQGKAQLRGGELMLDIHPHPLDWLHFENSVSLVEGINRSEKENDSTKYLPFIPAARLQSELRANVKKINNWLADGFFKIEYNQFFKQDKVLLENGTETPTNAYGIWNIGIGTKAVSKKGAELFSFYFSINNVFDKAYQNHLSRLKYAVENPATGRVGVFNMGRNFSVKLIVPVTFKNNVKN
jgi:iron complex outermembrane receptor protein